jgi:hypothetical protein
VRKPAPAPARKPLTPKAKSPPAKTQPPKRAAPVVRAPPKPAATPRPRPVAVAPPRAPAPAPTARPALRTWTSSAFVKVDPTANFYPALEAAGRAACAGDGGETLSVRAGDTLCPNGVNYCQVRAVATCQGAR